MYVRYLVARARTFQSIIVWILWNRVYWPESQVNELTVFTNRVSERIKDWTLRTRALGDSVEQCGEIVREEELFARRRVRRAVQARETRRVPRVELVEHEVHAEADALQRHVHQRLPHLHSRPRPLLVQLHTHSHTAAAMFVGYLSNRSLLIMIANNIIVYYNVVYNGAGATVGHLS